MKAINLSAKQIEAFSQSNSRLNILEGSVRSGKSYIALLRFLEELRTGPKGEYLIAGRSENTILRNVIDPLNEILGGIIRYNRGQSYFTIFDKKVYCVGANDERAELKIRGSTLAGALVDEVTALPESFFRMLLSRLSVKDSKLIGTTNPDSPYHWLKKDFLDREDELDMKIFRFRLDDNPGLSKEYVESLKKEYTGVWYQRFVEGLWVQAEGAIFDNFNAKIHIVDKPPTWAQYYLLGIDYGTTNALSAVLIGYNGQSHPALWVEKEYYWDSKVRGYQKTDAEYAQDIIRTFEDYSPSLMYLDPSAASFNAELKRQKQRVVQANNEVLDGIRYLSSLFVSGDLVICRQCKNLIESIQSYVWDSKSNVDGKERPVKKGDHGVDSLRYGIFTHFGARQTLKEKTEAERIAEREKRAKEKNPMYGWQIQPMHF